MTRYVVSGPMRIFREVVLDYGGGPDYPLRDVYLVDAPNAQAAKWAAFRRAKERGDLWFRDLDRDEHPLSDVTVARTDEPTTDWGGLYVKVDSDA